MADLTQALFRIDPTEGLLEYVQSIKPYHSKVLDVFVEYIYSEPATARVGDRLSWTISFDQSCAYLPIVSAAVGSNRITVSTAAADTLPKLFVGMQVTLAFNRYRPGNVVFTVTEILLDDVAKTARLTFLEPLSIESSKPPADQLTNSQVNTRLAVGSVAVQCPERKPVTYTCGFGFVWDPYSSVDLPTANIVSASGPISQPVTVAAASQNITLGSHPSNYVYTVNEPVVFTTAGTFPVATSGPITQGRTFYVTTGGAGVIQVSRDVGGTPITISSVGTGQLYITPQRQDYNTFLVDQGTVTPFPVVVKSLQSNQFIFAHRFAIINANIALNRWRVTGDLVSGPVTVNPGDKIYVNSNTDPSSNREYTVTAVSVNGPLTETSITVLEPISVAAASNGRLHVPYLPDEIPYWPAGSAIQLAASVVTSPTNLFPTPVVGATTYYLAPTTTIGVFNLSTKRYPTEYDDIVDLSAIGTGSLDVSRVEPFVPGESIEVTGTSGGANDGTYIIKSIAPEGANFRVGVYQRVDQTTPTGVTPDGVMTYFGSFGDPYCAVADAPSLHTETFIHEKLVFDFGDDADTGGNEDIPPYDVTPFL